MKYLKAFILILILTTNNFVCNLETSRKFIRTHSKFRMGDKFRAGYGKASTHVLNRFTSQKFIKSKFSLQKAMARTKEVVTAVVLVVGVVLKIGNAIMSHFINKMNQETLQIMNQEKQQNSETLSIMRNREIESCSTIKLIIQSNKQFFLLSQFKSIYFLYYRARLNEPDFLQLLNAENQKIFPLVKQTIDDMIEVRESLDQIEDDLLESLDDIEKDLCSQDSSYDEFKKRNSELDSRIEDLEKKLEKKEDNYFSNLFSGAWSGIKDFFLQTFELKDDSDGNSEETQDGNEDQKSDQQNEDQTSNPENEDQKNDQGDEEENIDEHDKSLFTDMFGDLSDLVMKGFNDIVNKVKKKVFQKIEKEISGIVKNIKIENVLKGNFSNIKLDGIKNSVKSLGDVLNSGVNNFVKNAKDQIVNNLQKEMTGLIDENLGDFVKDLSSKMDPDKIKSTLQKMGKNLNSGIDGIKNELKKDISKNLTGKMSELIDINFENILDVEIGDFSLEGIKSSFAGLQNSVESKIEGLKNKVFGTISKKISNFIGGNLSKGEMKKKFRSDIDQIKNTIKKFGSNIDLGPSFMKIFDKFKISDDLFEGVGLIMVKIIGFIGSISSLINKIPQKLANILKTKLGKYYDLVINLFNLGVVGVKWYLTPNTSDEYTVAKDSFWKIALKLAFTLAKMCIPGFSGIATDSVSFFKKVGDLFTAYKKKKQQTLEMNFYKTLADLKIKEQENTNKFKICLANLITMKSQYSTILEMSEKDDFFYKNMSEDQNAQSIIGEAINTNNPKNAEFYASKGVHIFKKEVKKICNLNVQFCSRFLQKKLLKNLEFSDDEIQNLFYLSTNGPFTDIVVSPNPETGISFIKMGYEPIAEKIYGCRMCTNNYIIRHVKIISDHDEKNIKLERENLLQGKSSNGKSLSEVLYKDNNTSSDYSEFIQQRLDTSNYLIYEIIHPKENDKPKLVLSRLLYYPLKYPDRTSITNQIPAIQAELSVWDVKNSRYLQCNNNYPKCDEISSTDHSIIITYPKTIQNDDNLNILWQKKYDGYKETSNMSFVPVGGLDDNYNPDYILDRSSKPNFLYFVYNNHSQSHQEVPYIQKNNSGKGTATFSLSSNIKLLPNHYNWVVREGMIPSNLIQNELGSFLQNNSIKKISIHRKTTIHKPSDGNHDSALDLYLIQFEPFGLKENAEIKDKKAEMDCNSVCDETNPASNSVGCVSSKMRFNDYKKLQDSNQKVLSIEDIKPKDLTLHNHSTLRINKSKDWKYNFYETTLKSFSKGDDFVYKKIIFYDYDDDQIQPGTEKEINAQKNEIKTSNRKKYLLIEKFLSLNKRTEDELYFSIKSKDYFENLYMDSNQRKRIRIKFDDINDEILILRVRSNEEQKAYIKELYENLKGYTMIHHLIIRDRGFRDDYLLVLVNPNPSSQHIPAIDNITTEFFSWQSDQKCTDTLYQNIEKDFCIKDSETTCLSSRALQFTDFLSGDSLEKISYDFHFKYFSSLNFTKLMFRKMFHNKLVDLNPWYLFKYPSSNSNGIFEECKEIDMLYPFYFPISNQDKANNLYRTLHINESDNSIQHVISRNGPGIKGIYWLLISSFENETEFSKQIIDKVRATGFSFFKKIEWVYFGKRMLYVTIYVQYDYRLKIDKEEICNLCMQVKDKMKNAPEDNKVDMNAIIKSFKKPSD